MKAWAQLRERYRTAGAAGLTERRVELAAIVLGIILLLQLVLGVVRLAMLSDPEAIRPGLGGVDVAQLASRAVVSEAQREEISERPLFWASRRPEKPAGEASKVASKGGRLQAVDILGVFGSGGTAGVIALVDEQQERILLGETLQGWELDAVHPDRVELVKGSERETLYLVPGTGTGAQPADAAQRSPAAMRGRREATARPAQADGKASDKTNNKTGKKEKSGESSAGTLGWGGNR